MSVCPNRNYILNVTAMDENTLVFMKLTRSCTSVVIFNWFQQDVQHDDSIYTNAVLFMVAALHITL